MLYIAWACLRNGKRRWYRVKFHGDKVHRILYKAKRCFYPVYMGTASYWDFADSEKVHKCFFDLIFLNRSHFRPCTLLMGLGFATALY